MRTGKAPDEEFRPKSAAKATHLYTFAANRQQIYRSKLADL
jgi:hypothetical protein